MQTSTKRLQISGYDTQSFTFAPDGEVRAGAVIIHGQGDFIERYYSVAEIFCQYGIAVVGIDLPGHGEASGTRGDIPSLEVVDQFIDVAHDLLLEQNSSDTIGILGHSVGALLGMRELLNQKRNYQFAWLNGPFLFPEQRKSKTQLLAFRALAKILPSLTISTGVKRDDCRKRAGANRDPLFHSSISLRWGLELIHIAESVRSAAQETRLDTSVLITQGGSDAVSPTELNTAFFQELEWAELNYKVITDALHETFLDKPEGFTAILKEWCQQLSL